MYIGAYAKRKAWEAACPETPEIDSIQFQAGANGGGGFSRQTASEYRPARIKSGGRNPKFTHSHALVVILLLVALRLLARKRGKQNGFGKSPSIELSAIGDVTLSLKIPDHSFPTESI
ncbi:hypothetical protein MTP99_014889 [Tenebrio molitor]|jgi:hypothetical protein|nr:hypothetical protein MTP99_014889 [Tenebrio molitor]